MLDAALLARSTGGSNAALVTFFIYTFAVFLLAWFSHRILTKRKFLSEYFLGSRGLAVIAFTFTFGATSASAGSFAGFPALIYSHGWIVALWIASYMVVPICAIGLLGKRLNQISRRSGAITLPDVFRERFNSRSLALVSTLVMVSLLSLYLVPQFKISGKILGQLLQDNEWMHWAAGGLTHLQSLGWVPASAKPEYLICLFFFALLVIAYTTFGGFRAVVWTDVMQGIVMVGGVVLMLILALSQVGGLTNATEKLAAMQPPKLGRAVLKIDCAAPAGGVRIATDQWFTLPGDTPETPRLFRLNESAIIPAGKRGTAEVKVVEIQTPGEIRDILGRFPERAPPPLHAQNEFEGHAEFDVEVRIVKLTDFAYGAGKPGGYVTGPGVAAGEAMAQTGFMSLGLAVAFFFYWALSGTGQPGNMVRLMAFNSARTMKRSIALLSIYFSLIYFPLVIIFCCARVLEPGLDEDPDRIMPVMAFSLTSAAGVPWLAGLLVAAPFAAAMSTVDSFMLMVSSSVARDVYQRNINPAASERTIKRLSYACVLIVGVVATLGAVYPPKYLQTIIVFAGGGLAAAFLIPMAMALYWRRANAPGVMAAMLCGVAAYLFPMVAGIIHYGEVKKLDVGIHPIFLGFAAAAIVGLLVTYLTEPPPQSLVRKFFYKRKD